MDRASAGLMKGCAFFTLKPLSSRVLEIFRLLGRERLDLHALFEAGGNEPAQRAEVLDAIEDLIRDGLIEAKGGDFYGLTEKGKRESPV